jgi:RNA polymerase sigma-70 factor (ECF subfamily)
MGQLRDHPGDGIDDPDEIPLSSANSHSTEYLLLIANVTVKQGLQAKIGASDLVQETFAEAHRQFHRFEGNTEQELLRWLSQILEFKIGNTLRYYHVAARRDVKKEVGWQKLNGNSIDGNAIPFDVPASTDQSPSAQIRSKEENESFRNSLNSLTPEQRMVVQLRVDENLTFEEIGLRMNRSTDAARKFYARTVTQLQSLLGDHNDQQGN